MIDDACFFHRYAAAAARPVATPACFARRPRFARPSGAAAIDDASTRTWWMRERRRRGVDVAGWWCKTQDICDGTSASRASPSDHKNTSDKNSKAVLRISVITLIRTDTTLDLSQKAEKGKSLLRLSADFCRFGGPQAMTLSRQFYDPGEGAAKRRRLARAWAPRGRRAHFLGLRIAVGLPRRPCARARQPRRGRRREEPKGCPGARWSAPRHALGCPGALGCFRWAASLLFALRSAAFTSRSSRRAAAARQQPKGLSARRSS